MMQVLLGMLLMRGDVNDAEYDAVCKMHKAVTSWQPNQVSATARLHCCCTALYTTAASALAACRIQLLSVHVLLQVYANS